HVIPAEEYDAELAKACDLKQGEAEPLEEFGARVIERGGCASCHTTDGSVKTGPSFKGLFGKTETFTDGTSPNLIVEVLWGPEQGRKAVVPAGGQVSVGRGEAAGPECGPAPTTGEVPTTGGDPTPDPGSSSGTS